MKTEVKFAFEQINNFKSTFEKAKKQFFLILKDEPEEKKKPLVDRFTRVEKELREIQLPDMNNIHKSNFNYKEVQDKLDNIKNEVILIIQNGVSSNG